MKMPRTYLALSAVSALALFASACGGGAATEPVATDQEEEADDDAQPQAEGATLQLLVWEGYADDELVAAFEESHGVEVNVTYIGSNDEVFAKLRAQSGDYDLIPATTDVSQQYIDAGLVQPLDLDNIPNYSQLFPAFQGLEQAEQDGQVYGVPHTWSADPIIYNADVVQDPDPSYEILWDEQYSGHVALYDDLGSLWVGALIEGYDPFTLDDDELAVVVERMVEQKPLLRKYWDTGDDLVNLFMSGEVVVATAWNYMYTQLISEGLNVERLEPREGNLGWVDLLMVPADASNKRLAELWIDWAISAEGGAITARASGYSIANPEITAHLTDEEVVGLHMDDPSFIDEIVLWEPVDRPRYQDAWNEVKSR